MEDEQFLKWLSYSSSALEVEKNSNLKYQASSPPSWILQNADFCTWRTSGRSLGSHVLWISGPTGYGKSVLAAYLCEQLQLGSEQSEPWLAYFFCKDMDGLCQPQDIIRGLACQLASQSKDFEIEVRRVWKDVRGVAELTLATSELFRLILRDPLVKVANSEQPVFVVLDALNECRTSSRSEIKILLRQFRANFQWPLVITSQPTLELRAALEGEPSVSLNENHSWPTVNEYIRKKLIDNPELELRFHGMNTINYIRENFRGMFLWVSMILEELTSALSEGDFLGILKEGPGEINDIYKRIFERLEKLPVRQKRWLRHIFGWLVLAKRPLLATELGIGSTVSKKLEQAEPCQDRQYDFEASLSICGSLIRVQTYREKHWHRGGTIFQDVSVSLVHESLTLFLTDATLCSNSFFIDRLRGHALIGSACLEYISDCNNAMQILDASHDLVIPFWVRDPNNELYKSLPLFSYASVFLSSHVIESKGRFPLVTLAEFLGSPTFGIWYRCILKLLNYRQYGLTDSNVALSIAEAIRAVHVRDSQVSVTDVVLLIDQVIKSMAQIWLSQLPDDDGSGRIGFRILHRIYTQLSGNNVSEYEKDAVSIVGNWAGFQQFGENPLWHVNVGCAYGTYIESCEHYSRALRLCDDLSMKNKILMICEESLVEGIWETPGIEGVLPFTLWTPIDDYINAYESVSIEPAVLCETEYTSTIYFARFQHSGSLVDLEKRKPRFGEGTLLGAMLQSRWEMLGLKSDLKESATLLDPFLTESELDCVDLRRMIGERYILQNCVQKLQDYIGEVETLLTYGGLVVLLKKVCAEILWRLERYELARETYTEALRLQDEIPDRTAAARGIWRSEIACEVCGLEQGQDTEHKCIGRWFRCTGCFFGVCGNCCRKPAYVLGQYTRRRKGKSLTSCEEYNLSHEMQEIVNIMS